MPNRKVGHRVSCLIGRYVGHQMLCPQTQRTSVVRVLCDKNRVFSSYYSKPNPILCILVCVSQYGWVPTVTHECCRVDVPCLLTCVEPSKRSPYSTRVVDCTPTEGPGARERMAKGVANVTQPDGNQLLSGIHCVPVSCNQ